MSELSDWDKRRAAELKATRDKGRELMAKWKERGIAKVDCGFHGGGDEGFFDEVTAYDANEQTVSLPEEEVDLAGTVADTFLPSGWENSDGGSGTITFRPQTGKVEKEAEWVTTEHDGDKYDL